MIPRLSKAGWREAPGRLVTSRSILTNIREAHLIKPPRRFAPPLLEKEGNLHERTNMRRVRLLQLSLVLMLACQAALAEVVRVEIRRRDDAGTHERLIGREYFRVDPSLPANRGIAAIAFGP